PPRRVLDARHGEEGQGHRRPPGATAGRTPPILSRFRGARFPRVPPRGREKGRSSVVWRSAHFSRRGENPVTVFRGWSVSMWNYRVTVCGDDEIVVGDHPVKFVVRQPRRITGRRIHCVGKPARLRSRTRQRAKGRPRRPPLLTLKSESAAPVVVVVLVPAGQGVVRVVLIGQHATTVLGGVSRELALKAREVGWRRAVLQLACNLGLLCLSPATAHG